VRRFQAQYARSAERPSTALLPVGAGLAGVPHREDAGMSDSGFRIQFSPHAAGLRADVVGTNSMENTIAYWEAILREIQARRPRGLLLVDRMQGNPLSAQEWLSLVEAMAGQGLETVRIAHVKPLGLERIEYCEMFAKEAGLDARVFDNEATADLWLRHGERQVRAR
jgi:hypothetical protein